MLPWISTRSSDRDVSGTTPCRIASTSANLFALPVTKLSEGGIGGWGRRFLCGGGGGDSVELVPKKWLGRERYVCGLSLLRERGREDI